MYSLKKIVIFVILILVAGNVTACVVYKPTYMLSDSEAEDDNIFTFEENNTLEIVVSENEKFILYFPEEQKARVLATQEIWHYGYGEWIRDGVAIPVFVSEEPQSLRNDAEIVNRTKYDYRAFCIWYAYENAEHFECEKFVPKAARDKTCYIAMLVNDVSNPVIRRWKQGARVCDHMWGKETPVECTTYFRLENDKWDYVDDNWWSFIHCNEGEEYIYSCEKGGFYFDAKTGCGEWKVNEIIVPIEVRFDNRRFLMNIYDKSNGKLILFASGYMESKDVAVFDVLSGDMFYKNSMKELIIKKKLFK